MLSDQSKRLVLFILALLLIGWVVRWWRIGSVAAPSSPEDPPPAMDVPAEKIDPRED